jgi:hypothetical protein
MLLNIWLYFHHGTASDASARGGKLCVMDSRLDQKIDGASGCFTPVTSLRQAQITMGLHALHAALLGCGTLGFGPEAELGRGALSVWSLVPPYDR